MGDAPEAGAEADRALGAGLPAHAAFDAALGDITRQVAGWVLVAGQRHEQQAH